MTDFAYKKNLARGIFLGMAGALLSLVFVSVPAASAQAVPHITGMSRSSGPTGTTVTVYGTGFSESSAVVFGSGIVIPEAGSSTTRLTFTVPVMLIPQCDFDNPPCPDLPYTPPPGAYPVSVTADPSMSAPSNSVQFTITPSVVITSIYPTSGPVGTQVTIYGRGFSETGNAIAFGPNGIIAQISNSTSVIKFAIPSWLIPRCAVSTTPCSDQPFQPPTGLFGLPYQISVAPDFDFNQASNGITFTLTLGSVAASAPVITSISPTVGTIGTQITIQGSNFSPNLNVIDFGPGIAIPKFNGNDLVVNVPDSLVPRCTIFGNPPCQVSSSFPPTTPGTYNLDVALDATKISNSVQFTVNPIPIPTSTPIISQPQSNGSQVQATANLNVRSNPSLSASIIGTEKSGATGLVMSDPVSADGYVWVEVSWEDGLSGWSAQQYLAAASFSPCPITVGDKVTVGTNAQAVALYVRSAPSVTGSIVGGELGGTEGTVTGGPTSAEGYKWWQIRFADGVAGWVAESELIDVACINIAAPSLPPMTTATLAANPTNIIFGQSTMLTWSSMNSSGCTASGDWSGAKSTNGLESQTPTSTGQKSYNLVCAGTAGPASTLATVMVNAPPIAISFVTPQNGATVSGNVTVTVAASGGVGVTEVDLYKDGVSLGVARTVPYSFSWDTTKETNGPHTLAAIAWDAARANASRGITVTVTGGITPPTPPAPIVVSFVTPRANATVSGSVPITVTASSSDPVTGVYLYIDGGLVSSIQTPPYTWSWDATQVLNGLHTLTATALTARSTGNKSISVNVVGGLSVPVVSFITPQANATVSGSVPITVAVSSSPSVAEVDLYIDGGLVSSIKTPPYTWSWDATQAYNGFHTLVAVAQLTAKISGSKAITVNVIGGKAVPRIDISFVAPKAGATVYGIVPVSVSVSSTVPISEVDFYKDGTPLGIAKSAPYALTWDATLEIPSSHSLIATARSASGSANQSISVNVVPPPLFLVGDRVMVQTGSNVGLNVRSGPSTGNSIIGTKPNGSLGTIIASPPTVANGYNWYQITWNNGLTGWSVEDYLVKQ